MGMSIFAPKTVTVGSVSDFLAQKETTQEVTRKFIPATLSTLALSQFATAASAAGPANAIQDKIIHSFDPLIEVISAMAYPLGFVMMTAGFLVIMTGNKSKGLHLIKWAALGFIGMQFIPGIMSILMEVGKTISAP